MRDVWLWQEGMIELHELAGDGYVGRDRSGLLPGLDLATLGRRVDPGNQTASVRRFRETLRRGGRKR